MSRATLTTGAKVLERRLKNRRLPDVPIPTTENPELARSLEGVKEHLRMYEGDSGAPKERFVTLQEMEDAGLITADTKNKFSFIAQVQGQDVVQPAGTAVATVRNTVIKTTGGGAAKLNDLSDVNAAGVSRSFLYYNGSKWVNFDLFGTINVWEVSQTFNAGILIANAEGVNWFNLSEDPVELLQFLEEIFLVGDPSYATRIDGLTTSITSAATDIDGTLNVDGTSAFNADVDLTTNAILTIWDAANTDKATITIKGDDLDIVGVGLSDLDIGGFTLARFQDVNVRISSSVGDTNYIEFEADGTDILATCYGTGSFIFRDIPDWIWIEDGCGLSIGADQTGAKNLYMFHDGTDFEFDFDGTTDWNISGITNMQLAANLVATGNIGFAGKLNANTTLVTTTTHTAAAEHVILVDDDTAAATVTVTLPLAATANTVYHIKKLGTTASVIVDGNGTETIDGALTATLNIQYESIMLVSDGSNWHVI